MAPEYYVGVDLGGTNIKAGLVGKDAGILVKKSIPTEAERGPDHILKRICHLIADVVEEAALPAELIGGLGLGAPGTLEIATGVVRYPPNLPGWRNVPIIEYVSRETGFRSILENDANAAAYAEYWVGAAKGASSIVMLTLGTGIGGGIIIDGSLVHGNSDSAGELGHIIVEIDGRECPCGNRGCLERYASANAVVARFNEAVGSGARSELAEEAENGSVTAKMIFEAAVAGDDLANRIFWETGTYLGIGIVNLLHTLNPARVVLAGGLIGAGDLLMRPVRETVEKRALPDAQRDLVICFATLGEDAGLIGAAGCALAAFETSR